MTIHLSKEQERFVHNAVRAGLYANENEVVDDAIARLKKVLPTNAKMTAKKAKSSKATSQTPKKPLSPDELNKRLLASGLVTRLPDPAEDIDDDDDPPIVIQGEPLSETIIRERR